MILPPNPHSKRFVLGLNKSQRSQNLMISIVNQLGAGKMQNKMEKKEKSKFLENVLHTRKSMRTKYF